MIRHIVLIRLHPDAAEADILGSLAEISRLVGKLPGLRDVTFGRSDSPEQIERGYTHALVCDFDDWAALNRYAEDPDHRRIGGQIVGLALGARDGVLVMDIPVAR
jgi:hypothetical protein